MKLSFYDWCKTRNRHDLLDRWDYDLNNQTPNEISCVSFDRYYFKCPENEHDSTLYKIANITRHDNKPGTGLAKCKYCNSFAQWGIDHIGENFLKDYWDYDKNYGLDPWEISYSANRKNITIYIKCQNNILHGSYATSPEQFIRGGRCSYCGSAKFIKEESFGQWAIDNVDKDFIDKYWGKLNNFSPYDIAQSSNKYIYIKCQERDYHGEYRLTAYDFKSGVRCPYCSHTRIHKLDSLGSVNNLVFNAWSDKNELTPYEYSPRSSQRVWFKCENLVHEDYKSPIHRASDRLFRCPKCRRAEEDSNLQIKVDMHVSDKYKYVYNKEYDCTLVCVNPRTGYILPYDREIIIDNEKLVIEVQGKQHFEICLLTKQAAKERGVSPEDEFEYRQWRDEYKKQYALSQGYHYLEIPYTAEDDDSYKTLIDDKISYILSLKNNELQKEVNNL